MNSSHSHVAVVEASATVQPSPVPFWRKSRKRLVYQAFLALTTVFTTTAFGMRYMYNFHQGLPPLVTETDIFPYTWITQNLQHLRDGLPFSLTLIAILLCHEFGHFLTCRRYNVKATLPYLLPAPTLSGTAGAIIRLRSRITTRRALLEVGAFGPLFGVIAAIPCIIAGLCLSTSISPAAATMDVPFRINNPLLFTLLRRLILPFHPGIPTVHNILPHPMLVAAWIGIFITSLNLLPAGQLDGGHIMYALSPDAHRTSGKITVLFALIAGTFCWVGWYLWCFLLFLPGMRHPRVDTDDTPLGPRHKLLAYACLLIFASTLMLRPFIGTSAVDILNRIFS